MRHGNSNSNSNGNASNNRRGRGRGGPRRGSQSGGGNHGGGNQGGGNNRSKVFDSNGPEVRIRGTAHQVVEKYEALARDASSSDDRSLAESYLQHAEHYVRLIASWEETAQAQQAQQQAKAVAAENSKDETTSAPAPATTPVKEASKAKPKAAPKPRVKKEVSQDDLGLPSSMFGEDPAVEKAEAKENAPA